MINASAINHAYPTAQQPEAGGQDAVRLGVWQPE